MNELVFLQNEQALTTSLKVATEFNKRHDHVLRDIEEQYGDLPEFGEMFYKGTYPDSYGRPQTMYTMNRDGFFMLVTGFTGKKARTIKLAFIKAFNVMERKIVELMAERQTAEWLEIRQKSKEGNKAMRAAIHEHLLPLARKQGYDHDEKFLQINYQRLVNRSAGIKPRSRDNLSAVQLSMVEKCQNTVEVSVTARAARGEYYKEIYQDTNQLLEDFSCVALTSAQPLVLIDELQS